VKVFRNFRVLTVWGIPIQVNISLVLFLPILAYLIAGTQQLTLYAGLIESLTGTTLPIDDLRAGQTEWLIGVGAAVGLFASVTLHELGHSWVALRYGLEVQSITLWILGGLASFDEVPREWDREFWIAVAGPITSVLVAAVCFGAVQVAAGGGVAVVFVLGWLAVANVTLAVFNMLPAFPMDGGRVFRALLARKRPYAAATRTAARVGTVFALLFAIVGVLQFSPILLLLALFIYGAATSESRTVMLADLLEGVHVADLVRTDRPTVATNAPLTELFEAMLRERLVAFPVTDGSGRVVGVVTVEDLRSVPVEDRGTVTVGSVVREDVPRVSADTAAFDALVAFGRGDVALVEDDGRVVGVVTQEDVGTALQLQREAAAERPAGRVEES
jgi:Zn-dependent protease